MTYYYNENLVSNARELRKNMTKEEKHLWYDFLKKLPFTVHRQKNIGQYITDFYVPNKKTVIEIDGLQHRNAQIAENDLERQKYLESRGITVIRYSNFDINTQFTVVCRDIMNKFDLKYEDLKK